MDKNEQQIKSTLQRISNTLMINGGFLDNPGLYTGEMGIVLFFARYAHFTQNELYSNYSFDLIEKIQERIDHDTPVNYRYGLSGIGSAFEYLVQNDFFEADADDILDDFDKRIFSVHNLTCLPVDEILGIGYYALWRMSGNSLKKETVHQTILPQIEHVLKDRQIKNNIPVLGKNTKNDFFSNNNSHSEVQTGLALNGLSLLTELDGDDSWISLFPNDLNY